MISAITLSPQNVEECFATLGISQRFDHFEASRIDPDKVVSPAGFFTFPTPRDNSELSILGLRRLVGVEPGVSPSFHRHPWYLEEPFGDTFCKPGWHSIAMNVTADSVGEPIQYADRLKEQQLYLASAIEVVLMLFLHFANTGKRLLSNCHTWTYNRTKEGRFVTVGAFGRNGVFVSSHEVGYQSRGLGICPKIGPHRDSQP